MNEMMKYFLKKKNSISNNKLIVEFASSYLKGFLFSHF